MAIALDGVRILDMTSVVMGPYATQILGDYGAEVVKIESPYGDTTRRILPSRSPDMGSMFLHLNRNKKSVVLDLKHPDGLAALLKLAESFDVLVYNVRPQAMARLGLTYERLSAANPRIIVLGLVGFNEAGPYAGKPVYEDLIQGITAVPSMLVAAGSQAPHYVPVAFNDRAVGLHGAIAILTALLYREKTGKGQDIQIPMFETMAQFTLGDHVGGLTFDPPLGPVGSRRTLNKERRPYATKDGFICVIVYTDKQWRSFMDIIGRRKEFDEDPRLHDLGTRMHMSNELYAMIGDAMVARTTAEWLSAFDAGDIPAMPMHTIESAINDPHLEKTGLFTVTEHPTEGRIRQMLVPSQWSETPPAIRDPAPRLGEHSVDVLTQAGFSREQIDRMLEQKVTAVAPEPTARA